ncbi:MAG TPA: AtpZ/AtpI family protein [Candidatus Eremiobacteraceae bacterium]|nr:AtpZ/AtpI family protein [Candidatus Eremiobacteraceae bacterium]
MKQPSPSPLDVGSLAGAGMTVVGTLIVGVALGLLAAKYLQWNWAVPVGVVLGFAAGIYSMYRQLAARM